MMMTSHIMSLHVMYGRSPPRMLSVLGLLGASQAATVTVLSNLQELCAEDPGLEAALRASQVVTDGGGEPAQISDLFDPAVDELRSLLGPEAFPSKDFCIPAVSFFGVVFAVRHV